MGKYSDLIDQLNTPAGVAVRKTLVIADGRANGPLCAALINHHDEEVRHQIAEVLGERGSRKAIPTLIKALADETLFVRHDACWSIETICHMEIGALTSWLVDIDFDEPLELKQKVTAWWRLVRSCVERATDLDRAHWAHDKHIYTYEKRKAVTNFVHHVICACRAEVQASEQNSKAAILREVQITVSRVLDKYSLK